MTITEDAVEASRDLRTLTGLDFPIPCTWQHDDVRPPAVWLFDAHETCPCRAELPICQAHLDDVIPHVRAAMQHQLQVQLICVICGIPVTVGPPTWRPLHGGSE